jgi:hypothetical protein
VRRDVGRGRVLIYISISAACAARCRCLVRQLIRSFFFFELGARVNGGALGFGGVEKCIENQPNSRNLSSPAKHGSFLVYKDSAVVFSKCHLFL